MPISPPPCVFQRLYTREGKIWQFLDFPKYFSGKRFSIVAKNFYPICKLSLCLIEMANPMMLQPPRTVWSRRNIFQSHWFHYVSDSFHINLLQDERRRVVGIATAAAGNELVEPVSFSFPLTRFTLLQQTPFV